jgi:hypothetical protein
MKSQFIFQLIIMAIIGSSFSSCIKDTTTTTTPQSPYYITFDLDGVAQEYGATLPNTSGGSSSSPLGFPHRNHYTGSHITKTSTMKNVEIVLRFGRDSIVEGDLMGLVGQQLIIDGCSDPGCKTAGMNINQLGSSGTDYSSSGSANSSTANFLGIDAVSLHSISAFGVKIFEISGSFDIVVNNGPADTQAVTNGKFKLLFPENNQ